MYAVVKTGGKQYQVREGDILKIEKIDVEVGSTFNFEEVLLVSSEGNVKVGKPFVDGAKVSAEILEHGKNRKITVFKYKPKKRYARKQGHRQPFTRVKINSIG